MTALALLPALCASAYAADKLSAFPVDPAQISIASISSCAFMANQLRIAHSADIMGAAMVAGGLYGCAVQDVELDGVLALASQAVGPCMTVPFMLDDVSSYKDMVNKLAGLGLRASPQIGYLDAKPKSTLSQTAKKKRRLKAASTPVNIRKGAR